MREILFRGKRLDNGEWVEAGTIISTNDADPICWMPVRGEKFLTEEDTHGNILSIEPETAIYSVDTATVGQYTGLTANGKRIFEGDVVIGTDALVKDLKIQGYVSHMDGSFVIVDGFVTHYRWLDYDVAVIGNIHDNPELLKGAVEA